MKSNNIFYFGYGANRDSLKISKILGKIPIYHSGATIEGYTLGYQGIGQIPKMIGNILVDVWDEDFKAYTIQPGGGVVVGIVWELTPKDFEAIKNWEFVGIWREIIEVKAKLQDGSFVSAFTDKAINSNEIEDTYDGLNYPNNLNVQKNITTDKEILSEDSYRLEKLKSLRFQLSNIFPALS